MEEFERNEVEIWPAVAWSMSRRKQFAYCPEAYFLHYGARGWIDFWDARAQRQLECLKQLKSIALWLDAVWSEIFFEYCYHCHTGGSQAALESDLRSIAQRKLSYLRFSLQGRCWEQDPKRPNIAEFYYGEMALEEVMGRCTDLLNAKIDVFLASNLCRRILSMSGSAFKVIAEPAHVALDGVKIYCRISAAFYERTGKLNLLLRSDSPENDHLRSVVGKYIGWQYFMLLPEKVSCLFYRQSDGADYILSDEELNIARSVKQIEAESLEFLQSLQPHEIKIGEKCCNCRFKGYCGA